ncbi:MAG: response regulator transcription factor [Candidatus Nanopelagicus sp.]
MSPDKAKSPLPEFTDGVHRIIDNAIKNNDTEFFYRLYLTRMAELSLNGLGKEFIEHAKSALDDSPSSLFMAKGFEAIGNLIDLDFNKCNQILDELEQVTQNLEIKSWVNQISSLCRAYINFHNGDYKSALNFAEISIASPIKSGTLDPLDKGRLIRLVCCISLIVSDSEKIHQCAQDILKIDNPDELNVLNHAKSAIKAMQLLINGEYKQAYELAKATISLEDAAGRTGIAAPFDCKFVLIRCLYEFSLIDEAMKELESLKSEADEKNLKFIKILCEVAQVRILSRTPKNHTKTLAKVDSLRAEIMLDPNASSMTWLVELAEFFVRRVSSDQARINKIVNRNSEAKYFQTLSQSLLQNPDFVEPNTLKNFPEVTSYQIIRKNLVLSKLKSEGVKKQLAYLKVALIQGEQVGAREIFLRQENPTLESIINLSHSINSPWLESLSRSCVERIKERQTLLELSGEQLTSREIEVLRYLSADKSIEQIGKILHISKNTMKTHLRNIYRKLEVNDRKQAAKIAGAKLLV